MGAMKRGDQINWNQVYYFSEIASAGSLKDAAERLGLSPSTLSEHLSQLELDLNLKLFQRQHRRLVLTPEGARLFQYARQMFETGKRFIDVISPTPLGCYPVSIGLVPGASYSFAYQTIQRFISQRPEPSVNVLRCKHDELESGLLESKLDFGFTDQRSDRKDIVQQAVVASEIRFFASAEIAHEGLRELLKTRPLMLCRSDRRVRSAVEEVLDSLELVPKSIVVSEFPSLVESLCREGVGVAAIGRLHLQNAPDVKMLRLPREFPALTEKLYATWVAHGENAEAVRSLRGLLADR